MADAPVILVGGLKPMAVKKTTKTKDVPAPPAKAEAKETAPKTTTKKAAPKKAAAAPPPEPTPAPPVVETPAKPAAKKAVAKKAAPPLKLSASQDEILKKIGSAGETGYTLEKKAEQRSIDSLLEKKLIKKGAKDKTSGSIPYHISSAGKKHLS
jgi:hypothetical protein